LRPLIAEEHRIGRQIPEVDADRCRLCGKCGQICQYGAIACLADRTLVFPELCHACGGCNLVCPTSAIRGVSRPIASLRIGTSETLLFVEGVLDVGQQLSPPVIRAVKRAAPAADLIVLDAPPGTACPAVETVRGSDLAVLVTEPTPFGLHDLRLAVEMVRSMDLPLAVVVNRADLAEHRSRKSRQEAFAATPPSGSVAQKAPESLSANGANGEVHRFCAANHLPILAELADDRAVAEAYSRGELACDAVSGYRQAMLALLEAIRKLANPSADSGTLSNVAPRSECRAEVS
jgi:MinD superfamily P-loop ATPase